MAKIKRFLNWLTYIFGFDFSPKYKRKSNAIYFKKQELYGMLDDKNLDTTKPYADYPPKPPYPEYL